VQMKDLHSAARELPAQLNLERMPHIIVNDDAEPTMEPPRGDAGFLPDSRVSRWNREVARDVTHAVAVASPPQAPQVQILDYTAGTILLLRRLAFQPGCRGLSDALHPLAAPNVFVPLEESPVEEKLRALRKY
jgi:hypothetical protein